MELHSYAKLRGYRKWTTEQKRNLVEARISYDSIFSKKSSKCLESWKKVIKAAKLGDFNVYFVRKQWANMLARYKAYKRTRLRQLGKGADDVDNQVVRQITEEWEFFYPLHTFMSCKTTNFHSYAQTPHVNADTSNSSSDHEDNETGVQPTCARMLGVTDGPRVPEILTLPNTDHDLYSKSAHHESDMHLNRGAFQAESNTSIPDRYNPLNGVTSIMEQKTKNKVQKTKVSPKKKVKRHRKQKQSERDKYYKHKRRYNRRNERRFDALLNVFGQMVKTHFPNVDTSKLETLNEQIILTDHEDLSISTYSTDSEPAYSVSTSPAENDL